MKYECVTDGRGNWYVIEVGKRELFDMFLAAGYEPSRRAPAWCRKIGGPLGEV